MVPRLEARTLSIVLSVHIHTLCQTWTHPCLQTPPPKPPQVSPPAHLLSGLLIKSYLHTCILRTSCPPPAHHQPRPKKRQTVRYLPLAGALSPASDPCPGTPHTPPSTVHLAAQGCSCRATVLQAGLVIPIAHLCDLGQVTSLGIRVFTYKTRDAVSAVGWV